MWKTEKEVAQIKEEYPVGSKLRLLHMEDMQAVSSGTNGIIDFIDDQGQLHMKWENGSSLALIPGEDQFEVIQKAIDVIKVEPGKVPERTTLLEEYENLKEVFDGRFEYVNLSDNTVLICDEEGKLKELEPNRRLENDIIVGTFYIAGDEGSDHLVSLTEGQMEEYENRFQEIEKISQEEVQETMEYTFYGF